LFSGCRSKTIDIGLKTYIERRDIAEEIIFSATILPTDISNVYSSFPGIIEKINKTPGSKIKKDDVIIIVKDESGLMHPILARENGILLALNYTVGDHLNSSTNLGMPIFTTGNEEKKILVADVDEMDAAKIFPGDTVMIFHKDSFSVFGKIDFVNLLATDINGVKRFMVRGHFLDINRRIIQFGKLIPVKIFRRIAIKALTVKANYLYKKGNKFYLKIIKNEEIIEREVIIGVETVSYIEIKSGVTEGETVVL
jgi:hypothetical protein